MFVEYDFYKSESIRQKIYGELVLRSGQITNGFTGTIYNEESKYKDLKNMCEGFELGIGGNHKINKNIELQENLRYMLTCGNKKDQELIKNRTIKFDNVVSNKLKIGVKGTYTGMEILKPYLELWYEHEFDGEVKAAIQDGKDKLGGISSSSSKGPTVIAELGASARIWKLDVDFKWTRLYGQKKRCCRDIEG